MQRAEHQKNLLEEAFDPIATFRRGVRRARPWDSIIDFATHRSFCGKRLYPRQRTLLKLIKLETENFSGYDRAVIEDWTKGFVGHRPEGVQPDVMDRIEHLKARGYQHFPHVVLILGRRGSKGIIGGVLGAERLAYFHSLGDWQAQYDVDAGADGYLTVVATNMTQAMRFQFNDIRRTVEKCRYLQPHISTSKEGFLSLRTSADRARIAEMKLANIPIEREIATLRAIAMSSNSASGRGAANFAMYYDEFAHMIQGTGGKQSSEEVYGAYQPSLDQFHEDSFTFVPSSPYCMEPNTKVLTEDLRWVPVGDLEVGDRLVGFDEHDGGRRGAGRTWQPAEVTHTEIIRAARYRVTTESGKRIVCTGEHLWLAKGSPGIGRGNGRGTGRPAGLSQRFTWVKTSDLIPGDNIKSMGVDPWDEDNTRDAGYLAGFFDGEGHFATTGLGMTQNRGLVLDKVSALLKERGFDMSDYAPEAPLAKARLRGGWPEVLRLLGTVRPERLLDKFTDRFYGGRIYGNAKTGSSVDPVVSVERFEDGPVVALATSTHTLVAEGLLSHNTQIGQLYDLYLEGTALMPVYEKRHGLREVHEVNAKELGVSDVEEAIRVYSANPEMLVVQLPSWALYEDWEISHTMDQQNRPLRLGRKPGPTFRGAIQLPPEQSDRMRLLERSNPEKFKVERRAQFASVIDAYLDPGKVDAMFERPFVRQRQSDGELVKVIWRQPLVPQDYGRFDRVYLAHADPGRTNANFAFAIAHTEPAPPDDHGEVWPHVIFDYLKVWKPADFDEHTIDYVLVGEELHDILNRFRSTEKLSFDQWNCQAGSTLIPTEHGLLRLDEMIGDFSDGTVIGLDCLVQSHHIPAVATQGYRKGNAVVRRLTTRLGNVVEATPEHRLWVRKAKTRAWHADLPWGYEHVRDVEVGDWLCVKRKTNLVEDEFDMRDLSRWKDGWKGQRWTPTCDESLGEALGLLLAEGDYAGDKCRFGNSDDEVLERYRSLMEKCFGGTWTSTITDEWKGKYHYGWVRKQGVVPWLLVQLGLSGTAVEKVVPWVIRCSPDNVVRAFLRGYFEGDGGVCFGREGEAWVEATTTSRQVAEVLQQLMISTGVFCTLWSGTYRYKGESRPQWRIKCYGNDMADFADLVGFSCSRKQVELDDALAVLARHTGRGIGLRSKNQRHGDEYWVRVTSIEETETECYDLSVPGPESYIANGVVSHNSAGFIAQLRQAYSPAIRIVEEPFNEKVNLKRAEVFKSAVNLGWVHSYRDNFYKGNEGSLLEMELKFLTEHNGKVVKQDFGPVTTKDLADCAMTIVTGLLHAQLDRYAAKYMGQMSFGSSDVQKLRSPAGMEGALVGPAGEVRGGIGTNRAKLARQRSEKFRARNLGNPTNRLRGRSR